MKIVTLFMKITAIAFFILLSGCASNEVQSLRQGEEVPLLVDATETIISQNPLSISSNTITIEGEQITPDTSLKMVDDKASPSTAALYAYLDAVGKSDGVLFGHQNDIHHKAGPLGDGFTSSDTKDVTGSIAAVMGIDTLSLTGNELGAWNLPQSEKTALAVSVTKEAAEEGAIITLSAHMPNFEVINNRLQNSQANSEEPEEAGYLSDGSINFYGYTPGVLTGNIVSRIMPGEDLNYLFTAYLDIIVDYVKALEAADIPILFRPFHENTGSWFWWGAASCDEEAFRNLYKYTVEYMRDKKDLHNIIYVYGPGGEAESIDDYGQRYPGDDYVDMVGFDIYHHAPSEGDNFISNLTSQLTIVEEFANDHGKLFAVTETGIANDSYVLLPSGNLRKDWYSEILEAISPTSASYFLLWANFGTEHGYYTPYIVSKQGEPMKGHEMLDGFIRFYNDPRSIFADQNVSYRELSVDVESNTAITGYMISPVSGSCILESVNIQAEVRNVSDDAVVKFIAQNNSGLITVEIMAALDSDGSYSGMLTNSSLESFGQETGTISLSINGEIKNTINARFNMPELSLERTIIDNFEGYYGDNEVLQTVWSRGKGSGCTVDPLLSDMKHDGLYGLEMNYSLVPGGYMGLVKNLDGVDWSDQNALRLWTKPDGQYQKVVIQITSGGNVFEVYLNEYSEFSGETKSMMIDIPFSSFVGRDNKEAVFDSSNIESFGLWCNTIVPDDADSTSFKLESSIYYDEIKAVNSNVEGVTFTLE